MSSAVDSTPQFIEAVYQKMDTNLEIIRKRLGRPLTYGEKVLYGHLDNATDAGLEAGVSYVKTRPDRVALQDATAQMAILQFMLAGKDEAAVPVTVHCDHLIRPNMGRASAVARTENREVMIFWPRPLSVMALAVGCRVGIIHQWCWNRWISPDDVGY